MDYRKEAPPFHVWNEGHVHELVCHSARDLKDRLSYGYSRCSDRDCDWCQDNRQLNLIKS